MLIFSNEFLFETSYTIIATLIQLGYNFSILVSELNGSKSDNDIAALNYGLYVIISLMVNVLVLDLGLL